MVLLTSGLDDCYWSFVLKMDTLSVVSVNSVTSACCKLYFCQDFALKMSLHTSIHIRLLNDDKTHQMQYKNRNISTIAYITYER